MQYQKRKRKRKKGETGFFLMIKGYGISNV